MSIPKPPTLSGLDPKDISIFLRDYEIHLARIKQRVESTGERIVCPPMHSCLDPTVMFGLRFSQPGVVMNSEVTNEMATEFLGKLASERTPTDDSVSAFKARFKKRAPWPMERSARQKVTALFFFATEDERTNRMGPFFQTKSHRNLRSQLLTQVIAKKEPKLARIIEDRLHRDAASEDKKRDMQALMALFLDVALQSEIWRDQEEDEVKPRVQPVKEVRASAASPLLKSKAGRSQLTGGCSLLRRRPMRRVWGVAVVVARGPSRSVLPLLFPTT